MNIIAVQFFELIELHHEKQRNKTSQPAHGPDLGIHCAVIFYRLHCQNGLVVTP